MQLVTSLSPRLSWSMSTPDTVPANGTFTVVVKGGDGNDSLTVLAKNTEIAEANVSAATETVKGLAKAKKAA